MNDAAMDALVARVRDVQREIGATPRDTQAMCAAIESLRAEVAEERGKRVAVDAEPDFTALAARVNTVPGGGTWTAHRLEVRIARALQQAWRHEKP